MLTSIQIALAKISVSLIAIQMAMAAIVPSATYTIYPPESSSTIATWAEVPELLRACSCESNGDPNKHPRQFNADGSILWGHDPKLWNLTGATTTDVGACQISLYWHGAEAKSLGLDVVNSLNDNVSFARILYERNGLKDWAASRQCWL